MKFNTFFKTFFYSVLTFFLTSSMAFAQGLSKVNTLMSNIEVALTAITISVVTVAILVVGYKVLYKKESLADCAYIIIGAVLIASASEIAKLLAA